MALKLPAITRLQGKSSLRMGPPPVPGKPVTTGKSVGVGCGVIVDVGFIAIAVRVAGRGVAAIAVCVAAIAVRVAGRGVAAIAVRVPGKGVARGVAAIAVCVAAIAVCVATITVCVAAIAVRVAGRGVAAIAVCVAAIAVCVAGRVISGVVEVLVGVRVEVLATGATQPVMVLESNVTAPVCARARPVKVAPVCRAMDVSARIFPMNVEFVPRVAELPTLHHTLHGSPPVTDEPDDVMTVSADLKIQTPDPLRVRFPDSAKETAQ